MIVRVILDTFANAVRYRPMHRNLAVAIDWLAGADWAGLSLGRHAVDGEKVFAIVDRYTTKPMGSLRWEGHRRYTDVQLVVHGVERVGWADISRMTRTVPYDAEKDVAWFTGEGDFFTIPAGSMAIFMPHDVHAPQMAPGNLPPGPVRKIVMKVEMNP